jgi:hypothetical protein
MASSLSHGESSQHIMRNHPKSLSIAYSSEALALHATRLTGEQFECLSRCAKGISLRFEASEIVDALVAGGYAEKGVAGIVALTVKGQQYLRTHVS